MRYKRTLERIKNIREGSPRPITRDALEKDIQATIVAYLKLKGIEVAVTDSSRVWGKGGGVRKSKVDTSHPDLSCVLPVVSYSNSGAANILGLAFFIEVKTRTGAIKAGQKEKLLALTTQGALCVLARSVDDVVRVVDAFHNKPFSLSALDKENERLRLALSDRRLKENRDSLMRLGTGDKNDNQDD